jgi:DNA invertase Pin-like site-specific DNA recombinase
VTSRQRVRRRADPADPSRVLGYARCSTAEQADSGAGLAAQEAAIRAECSRRGWNLVDVLVDAGASGKSVAGRPGLASCSTMIEQGLGGTLMVSKLDRLSRSVVDFAQLLARAQHERWNICALDAGLDLSTPSGS